MSARVLTMRLHQLARMDERLLPAGASKWASDGIDSLSYAIERLTSSAKLKPARNLPTEWKDIIKTCELGVSRTDKFYVLLREGDAATETRDLDLTDYATRHHEKVLKALAGFDVPLNIIEGFSENVLVPLLNTHEKDPKNINLIKFYFKQAHGPSLIARAELNDIKKVKPTSGDPAQYLSFIYNNFRLAAGLKLLDIFGVTARLLPYFYSMAEEMAVPVRSAIKHGAPLPHLPPPREKDKPESWQYGVGRWTLSWAKKALKPTPLRSLAPATQASLKACEALADSMAKTLKLWKEVDAHSAKEAEEDSVEYRQRMDAAIAAGAKYSDLHMQYRDHSYEERKKEWEMRRTVLQAVTEDGLTASRVGPMFRDVSGAQGNYNDPLERLRYPVETFGRMATESGRAWADTAKSIIREVELVSSPSDEEGERKFKAAVVQVSWKMGTLWRGTPQVSGFAEVADAASLVPQLVQYLHSAAEVAVDTKPVDRQVSIGNVGPWSLFLDIPAEFLKKFDIKVAPDEEEAAHAIKRVAASALALYHRIGVKDAALKGPIVVRWRDPEDSEDKKGASGYYHHDDGRVTVYMDHLLGFDNVGKVQDVNQTDATWTFVHEVAHRIYYKGLSTNARNYWHDIIQTMGDSLSQDQKNVTIAHAAQKLFDAHKAENLLGLNPSIGGRFMETGAGVLLVDHPNTKDINITSTLRAATPKEKSFAETIWWWYRDRWRHDQFVPWLNAKRYTKELPTEYANVTPTEAWPEAVANTLLKRPRAQEGRDTSPFVRAIIHRLLGQVRENVVEAAATLTRPTAKKRKRVPKPVLDKLLGSQTVEQVAKVGPVRVAIVMPDERMFDINPKASRARQQDAGFAVRSVGMKAYPADLVSDVVDKVKQAVTIMRQGGIPEAVLATRVVFDFTRRIDAYADADYTPSLDLVVSKAAVDVPTLIHELAHRVWFKGLGDQGRKAWLAYVDSIGEPLPEKVQTVAFAMAMREEQEILWDQREDDKDFQEMWVATMTRLEYFMNARPYLYGGMRIEEYEPTKIVDKASTADWDRANTLWLAFRAQHGTSPRNFGEWLEAKKYAAKLPSEYANTDEGEAWAEAVMDTLFARARGLNPQTHAQVRQQVMKALKHVHETLDEVSFTAASPVQWHGETAEFEVDDARYRVRLFGAGKAREVIFEAMTAEGGWTIGITGTGNPIRVLSSVVAAVEEYVKHHGLDALVFTSKGRGRTGTYSRMAKLLARQFGWYVREDVHGEDGVFVLGKTEDTAEAALKAKARSGGLWAKAVERHADKRIAAMQRDIARMRASGAAYAAAHPLATEARQVVMKLDALTESGSLVESLRAAGLDEAAFGETSVAVAISLPSALAKQFPDKGDTDPTPPHVTILVIGETSAAKWKKIQDVVEQVAAVTRPFKAALGEYGEFRPKPDFIVSHVQVESPGLRVLYKRILTALHENNIHFEMKWPSFRPHVTLSYGKEPWGGSRPSGSWTVNEVEVWRGSKSKIKFPLGEPAKIPLAASMQTSAGPVLVERGPQPVTKWNEKHKLPTLWSALRNTLVLDLLPRLYEMNKMWKAVDAMSQVGDRDPRSGDTPRYRNALKKALAATEDPTLNRWMDETPRKFAEAVRDAATDARYGEARNGQAPMALTQDQVQMAYDKTNTFITGLAKNGLLNAYGPAHFAKAMQEVISKGWLIFFREYGNTGHGEMFLKMFFGDANLVAVDKLIGDFINFAADLSDAIEAGKEAQEAATALTQIGTVGSWRLVVMGNYSKEEVEKFERAAHEGWKRLKALGVADRYLSGPVVLRGHKDKSYRRGGFFSSGGVASDSNVAAIEAEPGEMPSYQRVLEVIIHEVGHRLYYQGLSNKGRAVWDAFIDSQGEAWPKGKLINMLSSVDALKGAVAAAFGMSPDEVDRAGRSVTSEEEAIVSLFWWRWGYRNGHDPKKFIEWMETKKYTHALPSRYANTTPIEAWPEVTVDLALQRTRPGGSPETGPIILDAFHAALGLLKESIEESAPMCSMPIYGGLPTSGDFSAATEYEIGAQRAAEATHCLLGSIERAGRMSIQVEAGHIKEEMGIIEFVSKEYGKSLYSQRLIDGYYEHDGSEFRASLPRKSVESIRRTAPKLKAEAKKWLQQSDRWFPNDPLRSKAIRWCYYYIISLCDALVESVADFPKRMGNAYASLDVRTHARALRAAVDELLEEKQMREARIEGTIPKILEPLRIEAIKSGSWEVFKRKWSIDIKRGLYWHVTEFSDFSINPEKGPRDLSSMSAGDSPDAGKLMVTSDLGRWTSHYGKARPFAAQIDMSKVPDSAFRQVNRGMGNEFMIFDPSKARVVRVVTRGQALRIDAAFDKAASNFFAAHGHGEDGLRAFYELAVGKPVNEANDESPMKSLFTLAKYNDGLWKSERQGAYLTDIIRNRMGNHVDHELIAAVKAHGLGTPEESLIFGETSLIQGFGTRTAEKRRYTYQAFVIDGYGVKARLTAKATPGIKQSPDGEPYEEGAPVWGTLQVAWKRTADSGPVYVEPTGKAEREATAKAIEANQPMLDMIARIPDWMHNSFLRDMHHKLALGADLSIGMKGALDRIFAQHGLDRTSGDDASSWERGWRHFYTRLWIGGPATVHKAKQEAEATIRDKNLTHLDAERAFAQLQAEMHRVDKETIQPRETYESPWTGGMNLVHQFLVDDLAKLGWKYGGWRRYFVGSKRADQNPGVVGLLADAKFAIQQARAGKNIDKPSLRAIQDVMRFAEKMGLKESAARPRVVKVSMRSIMT